MGYSLAGLIVLTIGWLLITGLLAKRELSHVQTRLAVLRQDIATGDLVDARRTAKGLPDMAGHAHALTTGPAWWLAAQVPVLGRPAEVARGSTAVADDLTRRTVPDLIDISNVLDPQKLRTRGNGIELAPLVRSVRPLHNAVANLAAARQRLAALPDHTWFSAIDQGRVGFAAQLTAVSGYIEAADRAAQVLPTMLGADGPQRYFIGLQNEAEMRGTGGLPGAFAIAVADHGRLTFTHFESDSALLPAPNQLIPTGLQFGSEYDALYGASQPTASYVDSNASPNFPYAAEIWSRMWQKVSGERVDGVVGVDPTFLAYVLAATGPTTVGKATLTSDNVVALTQRDAYALFPNPFGRKAFLVSVLKAAATKVTGGGGRAVDLARAVSVSSGQRRFVVWSRSGSIERVLKHSSYAGVFGAESRPLAAPILNNAAAGKLDYYVSRSFTYSRTGCGSTRDVVATMSFTNDAPATGLPNEVVTRLDSPPTDAKPGDTRSVLDYYATGGSRLQSVTINGKATTAASLGALGRSVYRLVLELPRGTTTTVVLHLSEPAGRGTPQIWRQPGVIPLAVQEFNQSC